MQYKLTNKMLLINDNTTKMRKFCKDRYSRVPKTAIFF